MTIESQIQELLTLGYDIQTATLLATEAAALVMSGSTLADYLPTAEQLDTPISDGDLSVARTRWYADAPDEFVRILDASEVGNA